jgi:RNA polymerase sigma factor (sigma-70 family)
MPNSPHSCQPLKYHENWWDFQNDPGNMAQFKKMAERFEHFGETADDIVSEWKSKESFIKSYQHAGPSLNLQAWCRNGLKWTSIKLYRERYGRGGRRPGTPKGAGAFPPVDPSDPRGTPDTELQTQQMQERLHRAVAELPPVQCRIIHGRYFDVPRKSYEQLSDELQIPVYQVKKEEYKALKKMNAAMRPFVDDPDDGSVA